MKRILDEYTTAFKSYSRRRPGAAATESTSESFLRSISSGRRTAGGAERPSSDGHRRIVLTNSFSSNCLAMKKKGMTVVGISFEPEQACTGLMIPLVRLTRAQEKVFLEIREDMRALTR